MKLANKIPLHIIGDGVDAQMNEQLIIATITTCANISIQGHTNEEGTSNNSSVVVEHMVTSISSLVKFLLMYPSKYN